MIRMMMIASICMIFVFLFSTVYIASSDGTGGGVDESSEENQKRVYFEIDNISPFTGEYPGKVIVGTSEHTSSFERMFDEGILEIGIECGYHWGKVLPPHDITVLKSDGSKYSIGTEITKSDGSSEFINSFRVNIDQDCTIKIKFNIYSRYGVDITNNGGGTLITPSGHEFNSGTFKVSGHPSSSNTCWFRITCIPDNIGFVPKVLINGREMGPNEYDTFKYRINPEYVEFTLSNQPYKVAIEFVEPVLELGEDKIIDVDNSFNYSPIVFPGTDSFGKIVSATADDGDVLGVSVLPNGRIHIEGKQPGIAKITATVSYNGMVLNDSCYVTVRSPFNIDIESNLNDAVQSCPDIAYSGDRVQLVLNYDDSMYSPPTVAITSESGETIGFDTDGMTYSFDMPESDVKISLTFNPVLYKITFKMPDGSVYIEKGDYLWGQTIVLPDPPVLEPTVSETFEFVRWDGYHEDMTVDGNREFTAIFDSLPRTYVVSFHIMDDVISYEAEYGSPIQYPDVPSVSGYVFTGWSGNGDGIVTGDMEIHAEFRILDDSDEEFIPPDIKKESDDYLWLAVVCGSVASLLGILFIFYDRRDN